MSFSITDASGEEQEISDDESVLVLARSYECALGWMRDQGLPPYARQFKVMPSARSLEGYRPQTIIITECYSSSSSLEHRQRHETLERSIAKSTRGVRFIEVACR